MPGHRYRAFISYSHVDEKWADWLQRRLENFRSPDGKHPLRPVFRDRSELAAGELSPAIETALASSEALIVICSPAAAASQWVAAEVRSYQSLHVEPLILPCVVEGIPDGAYDSVFPEPLRRRGEKPAGGVELLAADARPDKDGRSDAVLKLAAALLGVSFDSLKRRADATRARRLLAAAAGAMAVAAGAVTLAVVALLARQEADTRRQQAEELVTFMIGDVREELGGIGRLDLMEAVGTEALAYFESLDADDLTPGALLKRGRALRQIGDVRFDKGEPDAAFELYHLALDTLRQAATGSEPELGESLSYEQALTYLALSGFHYTRGDVAASRADGIRYRDQVQTLAAGHPEDLTYLSELTTAENNLGALAFAEGDLSESEARFTQARELALRLIERRADDPEFHGLAAGLELWLGNVAERQGNEQLARDRFDAALARQRLILRLDPSPSNREALARTLTTASVANRDEDAYLALEQAREAMEMLRDLVAFEPDNTNWQQKLNRSIGIAVGTELEIGCGSHLPALLEEARSRADQLLAADEGYVENHRDRIDVDVLHARYAIGTGSLDDAESMAEQAVNRAQQILARNPADDLSKRYLLRASRELVRSRWLRGDEAGARAAAAEAIAAIGTDRVADPPAAELKEQLSRTADANFAGWPPDTNASRRGCDP